MVLSYSPHGQIFDPMNDLDKHHFLSMLIRNSYYKVGFFPCLFWLFRWGLGDTSPWICLISSCVLWGKAANCHLFLVVFPSMFLEHRALEDRRAPVEQGDRGQMFSSRAKARQISLLPLIKCSSSPSPGSLSYHINHSIYNILLFPSALPLWDLGVGV